MSTKRLIKALHLPGTTPGVAPARRPEVTWIDPTELLVDESYQRGVGEKGLRLIRRIVEHFDWRRFKPPTAVWTDEGLEVIDGQHSAIAAATHPGVAQIPILVVEAPNVKDRASAFIGINRDRLNVTMMQIHAAGVTAGEESALKIEAVCKAAGLRMLKASPSNRTYQPRDTLAVRAIGNLIRQRGVEAATEVLRVAAEAGLAPVSADAIKAADFLMHDEEHAETFERADLSKAIAGLGVQADREAGVFAAEHCVPKWRGLAAVWFRKTKRRRPRSEASPTEPTEPAPEPEELPRFPFAKRPTRRIIVRRPSAAAYDFGDPEPGRSANAKRTAEDKGKSAAR